MLCQGNAADAAFFVSGKIGRIVLKESGQQNHPGINYDFYVFLDPIIEYVDAHSPYTVEFDDDQTPTTAKLVSTVDNKVWFSLTKQ